MPCTVTATGIFRIFYFEIYGKHLQRFSIFSSSEFFFFFSHPPASVSQLNLTLYSDDVLMYMLFIPVTFVLWALTVSVSILVRAVVLVVNSGSPSGGQTF